MCVIFVCVWYIVLWRKHLHTLDACEMVVRSEWQNGIFRQEYWIAVLFCCSKLRDRKKVNYFLAKQRTCQNWCKDYVIGREMTTVLKIAVYNVILELNDTCDCFASPWLMEKTINFKISQRLRAMVELYSLCWSSNVVCTVIKRKWEWILVMCSALRI